MEKIYCISGMAADERVFSRLKIDGYKLQPVSWIPFELDDTLQSYAKKLSLHIPGDTPLVLGYSLGGMLAIEICKLRATKKTILISSAKCRDELPQMAKIPLASTLVDLLPDSFFAKPSRYFFQLIGTKNAAQRKLVSAMMRDTPGGFMKWQLKHIIEWKNKEYSPGVIHVHGTKDLLIPPDNVQASYLIKGGTHLMIYNRAEQVSKIISDCLSS